MLSPLKITLLVLMILEIIVVIVGIILYNKNKGKHFDALIIVSGIVLFATATLKGLYGYEANHLRVNEFNHRTPMHFFSIKIGKFTPNEKVEIENRKQLNRML